MSVRARAPVAAAVLATVIAAYVVATRVHLTPDVSALLPDEGEAAALSVYARVFGGGDPGLVLLTGDQPAEVARAAQAVADAARASPAVRGARAELASGDTPPSALFLVADDDARVRMEAALTPDGMRRRLADTRALLLAPGGGALAQALTRDPLRLAELAAPRDASRASPLASEDGRARLVVVEPRGSALSSAEARAFVHDVEAAVATATSGTNVRGRLTGGHAIAVATESMIRADVTRSSTLSLALGAALFLALYRRPRALLAILPPLAAGTLITGAFAALFPGGLSAIAVAFASVVLGVGMDTGVHLYASVRDAARAGDPDPAGAGLRASARAVLGAATVAASAFGSLALSRVPALRQLGVLSALGEVVTALVLLAVTPPLAAALERGAQAPARAPAWTRALARLAARPATRIAATTACALALVAVAVGLGPRASAGLVSVRPTGLAPAAVYDEIAARLGGPNETPHVVLVTDEDRTRARDRTDALALALARSPDVTSVGALVRFAPGPREQAARRARRDLLDLPGRADALAHALRETGFEPARFDAALADLRAPVTAVDTATVDDALGGHFLRADGAVTRAVVEVRPAPGREAALTRLVASLDPRAVVTGYPTLETQLAAALSTDLPRAGALCLVLVALALGASLRTARDTTVALFAVVSAVALVLVGMRALGVPLHVYDALVLPVLLGITVDEVLFVLLAERHEPGIEATLAREGPLVATTALATAAGFGALLVCRFDALRHLGATGALGSVVGLLLALVLVPAWSRARGR